MKTTIIKTKHLFILAFAILVLIIQIQGCGSKDKAKGDGRYYDKEKVFSISFPDAWIKIKSTNSVLAQRTSETGDKTHSLKENVSVSFKKIDPAIGLEGYYQKDISGLNVLTDLKIFETGQSVIDNTDAKYIIYSSRMGKYDFTHLSYFLVKNNMGFMIVCTAASDNFASSRSEFEKIASSFKFESGANVN